MTKQSSKEHKDINGLANEAIANLAKLTNHETNNAQVMARDCLTVAISNNEVAKEKLKEMTKLSKNIKNRLSEANTIIYVLKHKQSLVDYASLAELTNALELKAQVSIQSLYAEALPYKKAIKTKLQEKNLSKKALNEALEDAGISASEALLLDDKEREAIQAAIIAKKMELEAEKMQNKQAKIRTMTFEEVKALVQALTIEQKGVIVDILTHQLNLALDDTKQAEAA